MAPFRGSNKAPATRSPPFSKSNSWLMGAGARWSFPSPGLFGAFASRSSAQRDHRTGRPCYDVGMPRRAAPPRLYLDRKRGQWVKQHDASLKQLGYQMIFRYAIYAEPERLRPPLLAQRPRS
jgi:hypothetical protein